MLSCRDTAKMISDGSMETTGFFGKLFLRLHLMMCSNCRRLLKQIGLIGRLAREQAAAERENTPVPEGMEKRIVDRICGGGKGKG